MKEILIYGAIGQATTARDVVRQFQEARGEDVLLRIHSEGGSVLEGEAILNAIRLHDATVFGQIDGAAFSMAAVIALELRELGGLTMPEDGWLMWHEVRNSSGGTQEDLERQLVQMKAMNASIANKLADAMNITVEDAAERLKEEIWMNGTEALAAGLVTAITPAEALAAHVPPGEFKNVPKQFSKPEPTTSNESTMKLFKVFSNDKVEAPSLELAEIGPEDLGSELAEAQKTLDETLATHAAALIVRDEKHAEAMQAALTEQRAEFEASHAAELNGRDEKHAEALVEKDAAIVAAKNSSEKQANEILSQAGHSPVETTEPEEKTIKEHYLALKPGADRQKFREDHKAELSEAFGPGVLR